MKNQKLIIMLIVCISLFFAFALSVPVGGHVTAAVPPDNPDSLVYSTFLGSGANDAGKTITIAEDGKIYVGGSTRSPDFPTTAGAFQTTFAGAGSFSDGFVAIFNPDGSLVSSTYLGGTGSEGVLGIEVDEAGFVYVIGATYSNDFPTTFGAYDENANGRSDVFVTKLDPTLSSLEYSTYVGGSTTEDGIDMALDYDGNVYVTGYTDSSNFPTTAGAYDPTENSVGTYAPDAFLFKLNDMGNNLIFSSYLGGTGEERGQGITIDPVGNVYVSGMTKSSNFPTTVGAFDTNHGGSYDIYVAKFNSTASILEYATYVGGGAADMSHSHNVHVDTSGNVQVSCKTGSTDFPTTSDAFDVDYNGGPSDVCIFKLTADGSALEYSTYVGGTGEDYAYASTVGDSGNLYVSGWTNSSDFPMSPDAFDNTYNGGSMDAFVLSLNVTGVDLDYSTFLGGSNTDEGGGAISVDDAGDMFVTGRTFSSDFPITADAYDTSYNGGEDVVLTVFSSPNKPPVADAGGPYLSAVNQSISFGGGGSYDPDGDPLTYAWDFGDSNTGTGEMISYSYAAAGIYDVCLTVNDGSVDSAPDCTLAVVYDPEGGFVTGGGWIYSEAGWCRLDDICAGAEGKANFGFVSKYKKGASVPTGNTEFNFKAGGLNFHSSSYEWLVVNQSDSNAQYKGQGTINGEGDYKFMLWAGDDEPDTFRIKIWYEDEVGNETAVYDNGFDQAIGGGNIVVHTGK